jgi:hypothetical protein
MDTGSAIRRAIDRDASIVLHERSIGSIDPAEWDRVATASDGSFLGSWGVIRAERMRRTVRVFEFFSTAMTPAARMGQCAVAVAGHRVRFLDRIHLLPEHAWAWERCLGEVVARCRATSCTYGSTWNHETRCAASSSIRLPGGRVTDGGLRLDCIDFSKWSDFSAYRRAVSENLRRDYKKAAAAAPVLTTRRGMHACLDVPALVGLRRQVMRRNAEPFSSVVDAPVHALKLMCLGDDAFISVVEAHGRVQAAFFGVRFGRAFYYVSGGTPDKCEGFGSFLFLTLIEQWFAEQPRGKLYLGITEPGHMPEAYTRGNLLYRRKLRAISVPGTAFTLEVG